eukprot:s105_g46.t1
MPPKVVRRRPAARAPALRRPAARVEREEAEERRCLDLGLGDLPNLGHVWLKGAGYYSRSIDLVGRFVNLGLEENQPMGTFEVSGTQDEGLLRSLSGKADRRVSVHLCAPDCPGILTDEFLVHGRNYVKVEVRRDAGDDLALLREDEMRRKAEVDKGVEETPKLDAKSKKEKKADKKAKKREAETDQKKRARSESEEEWEVGQKPPKLLFEKTGLDPDTRQRNRFLRKARKVGRSKKSKKKKKKQCLMGHMSPPMGQEALTVAQSLDRLLQGHAAAACDILAQRLKSLEASSRGAHWTMSRQLELIRSASGTMAEDAETYEAAKRAREEDRLRSLTSRPSGIRGSESGGAAKGVRKGKDWKGTSKGKHEDGAKGKGGDKKEDTKPWQKEKK